jgi:hypothetical protein
MLDISTATIVRWRREGCPAHRIGSLVRYRLSEVIKWRNARTKHPVGNPEIWKYGKTRKAK